MSAQEKEAAEALYDLANMFQSRAGKTPTSLGKDQRGSSRNKESERSKAHRSAPVDQMNAEGALAVVV